MHKERCKRSRTQTTAEQHACLEVLHNCSFCRFKQRNKKWFLTTGLGHHNRQNKKKGCRHPLLGIHSALYVVFKQHRHSQCSSAARSTSATVSSVFHPWCDETIPPHYRFLPPRLFAFFPAVLLVPPLPFLVSGDFLFAGATLPPAAAAASAAPGYLDTNS